MGKLVKCARCKGTGSIRPNAVLGPGKEKHCPIRKDTGKIEQK